MRNYGRAVMVSAMAVLVLSVGPCPALAQTTDEKAATGSISGVVTKDGEPAAGVGLLITESTPGPPAPERKVERTHSDKEGRFSFSGLERGSYAIETYLPGAFVRRKSTWNAPTLVTVGDGESVTGLKIELEPGAVITGKVLDIEGKIVAGETIHLYVEKTTDGQSSQIVRQSSNAETDDRGVYRIFGLTPGRYAVGAGDQKTGFGSGLYELTFHGGAGTPETAKLVAVESGTEAREIDLVVRRGAAGFTIVGKVLDAETRKPVTNARIFCGPIQNGRMEGMSGGSGVRSDGEFAVEGKAPGTYGLMVLSGEADGSYYGEPVEVVVADRDVTGVIVEMHRGATISGVVVPLETDSGLNLAPIRSDSIYLQRRSEAGEGRRFMLGSSGQFRLAPDMTFRAPGLRIGEYTAVFNTYSPVKGFYVARVEVAGAPLVGPIRITEPIEISGVRIVVGRAAALLRGRVVLRNGTLPFERVGIRLRMAVTNQHLAFLPVDSKGVFQMEFVPPGEYEASAIATSFGEDAGLESKPVAVSVGSSGTVEVTVELDLKPETPPAGTAP